MTAKGGSIALKKVADGNLCSGCGACAAIAPTAIEMQLVDPGFLRPVVLDEVAPEEDARISSVCPGLGIAIEPDKRSDDPLWGPYVELYTGFSRDPALRHKASSGGALSALLVHLLESGEVDRVLQVGADNEVPFANRSVVSTTSAEVIKHAGSRYAPSAPLANVGPLLESELRHVFVGKPCDVAALRAMARDDPRIALRIPWMLSFFCAGVPSHAGAREVLAKMGLEESDVVRFRYRGNGWPGNATATLRNGQTAKLSYSESWGGVLSRHVQARCKICPDGTGGAADVVFADAWETNAKGYPVFEERDGISLVMARTERGHALVRSAEAAGRLALTPFDVGMLEGMQPGQTSKRRLTLVRMAALRLLGRPIPEYRGFHLLANARKAGMRASVRNFFGTLRRGFLGRL
ncbi:coenzyme F420 hydrogenase subunit beta [Roseivivax lentus]|uniref:Coenzyme F420 hydrogenase subunit beta n=1 Tax=Roseivivax lentus TaxID=633194 RepID=A0A1N7P8B8_9RHOB|nr:Coenzyme F420 hydrogenase/dehydrogenase, beta subunit C-terminal domain [Roseivivax lentus]SIT06834.1 coenzyme F420 hydrogenase subunit beta [Roseivivax lentus]